MTPVLRNLAGQRKHPEAKRKLANHPVTRLFLKAGVSIYSAGPMHMGAVTKPRILAEAQRIDEQQGTNHTPNEAKFRDRWRYIDEYRADLFSYCLSLQHWSLHVEDADDLHARLSRGPSLYDAIQNVAYQDLRYILENDFSKIPFLIALSVHHDPVARKAIKTTNLELRRIWGRLCGAVLDTRGLRLRPGRTMDELADLLVILADGIAFRLLADEDCGLIDHDERGSLLGKGAAALVAGFIDPGDGKPLKEILDRL